MWRLQQVRIVGGKYRHRIITWPDDQTNTRPTKDRVREAVFSAIGDIDNCIALDLYSGSGAMGIEALSRGCSFCYFVDIAQIALKTIKQNLNTLSIPETDYMVIPRKDYDAIKIVDKKIDILILDPPYKQGMYYEIIDACKDIQKTDMREKKSQKSVLQTLNFLLCLIEKCKKLFFCLCLKYLYSCRTKIWYSLKQRRVGKVAAHMYDASKFGSLALIEGIVLTKRILDACLYLPFEDVEFPVERH